MSTFFLLNLCISGIKNIERPIEIPFYKKTIKNDFDPEQYRIKGIYGENGSGKTAVMTAVRIMTRVLLDRNYLGDSVNQRVLAETINKKTGKSTIEAVFFASDETNPSVYHYRMDLGIRNGGRVYLSGEKLERQNGRNSQGSLQPVFETREGNLSRFGKGELYEYCSRKTQNLLEQRSLATFICDLEAAGYDLTGSPERHLLALAMFAAVICVEIDGEDDHRGDVVQKWKSRSANAILREAEDLTIYSWASATGDRNSTEVVIPRSQIALYRESIRRLFAFIRIFKTGLLDIEVETKEYGEFYLCRRIMVYDGFRLEEEYESRGIKKLMRLFSALDAACRGNIVFVDELDTNINDIYLDKLIEYFVYYGKGQLCFTAHNLSPMSVLRNSRCAISFLSGVNTVQTWVSKGNQNPEHAYRDGFIDDSPFNVDASDFLGILGGTDE